jgi:heavy metal translocating P-type ATPase
MVRDAAATKARSQLFIEKVEQRYSVGVVIATLLLFAGPLMFGAPLQPTLLRAMTFMIVASPCAVVLATMPPLLSAIANAGRHGVLVKSAVIMEQLGGTTQVAFDKTGTLTEGTPRVAVVRPLPGSGMDIDRLLTLAAAAEYPSEHPLGRAIVAAASDHGLVLPPAEEFDSLPGRGVTARVDGHRVDVSSPGQVLAADHATEIVAGLEDAGLTAVVVHIDAVPAAVVGLADRPRPAAPDAVAHLSRLTGTTPVMLTGDNPRAAAQLAAEAGIDDVRAGLLPEGKVAAVGKLQRQGHRVLVVGDGVNDAPALAAADTGLAMGRAGADLSLDTADAVIVHDELGAIPALIDLSRQARRFVIANLAIAATFITVLVIWDLVGTLPLPLGVAGHEGSTVIVGLNGLRLLRESSWRPSRMPPT